MYTVVTDSAPSAVRALSLVLMVCAALFLGRPAAVFNAWAAGGLLVLALNPADLFRAGPQLSFLAVATMSWFAAHWTDHVALDPLDRLIAQSRPRPIRWARGFFGIAWKATLLTTAIWLVGLPLVMLRFHLVSPVGIVMTTLLMVPVGIALFSGFAVMLIGWLWPFGAVCGWLCRWSLWLVEQMTMTASQLPGGFGWVPGPPEWLVAGFYLNLAVWAIVPRWQHKRITTSLAILWSFVFVADRYWPTARPEQLECTFLAVGHGCCAVLHLPDGRTMLYDAGRLGSPVAGARTIAGYLWQRRITRIDMLVISHADLDHYNAVPDLLEKFAVRDVYVSPTMFRGESAGLSILREAIQRSGARLLEIAHGAILPGDGQVRIEVLHPPPAGVRGNDNANSVVLAVDYRGKRMLLPGDLEAAGMEVLLSRERLDCDLLLAPHHGSARSDPPGFGNWCRPEHVIISGALGRDHTAVIQAYREQGAAVLDTAYDGAIQVQFDEGPVRIHHWHLGGWRLPD